MTFKASSSRPGFSYLVGVTDKVCRRFRNLSDTASCGGDGTIGKLRNDEYDGGKAADGRGESAVPDCIRGEKAACDESEGERLKGEGDEDRDARALSCRALSRLDRSNCSNCFDRSVAS